MLQKSVLSGVPGSPGALLSRRSARVTFHTTSDVKQRLEALAAQRGWTLSKAAHLAVLAGLPLAEGEQVFEDVKQALNRAVVKVCEEEKVVESNRRMLDRAVVLVFEELERRHQEFFASLF